MKTRTNMKRSRKSISWASGVKLCQVKLFSSFDCPVEVGLKFQSQYQQKPPSMLHSTYFEASDIPPGFEVAVSMKQSKFQELPIPRIRWQCPPKLTMNEDWCVAAGEESEEAKTQKVREMAVFEAVYPRSSAIPHSPAVSFEVECDRYDHSRTLEIPINPIEEESQEDQDQEHQTPINTIIVSQQPDFPRGNIYGTENASESRPLGFEQVHAPRTSPDQSPDFTAVASAALTAMTKSSEKGSMIDTDLLVKILNDPKMLQKLINVEGPQANTGMASTHTPTPPPSSKTVTPYVPTSLSNSNRPGKMGSTLNTIPLQSETVQVSRVTRPAPSPRMPNERQPPLSKSPLGSFPVEEHGIVKDMNYYKNLIRQHGADNNEMQDPVCPKNRENHNQFVDLKMSAKSRPSEMKRKSLRSCIFFNSAKGCRNGAKCEYVHDMSLNWRNNVEAQSAKRMKLNGVN